MRILVGSSDDAVRRLLAHVLGGPSEEIRGVSRSADLLKAVLDADFDLVLVTLRLGGMTGLETLAILKRLRPKLPVFVLSEDDSAEVRAEALEGGALHYFVLPVHPAALVSAVRAQDRRTGQEGQRTACGSHAMKGRGRSHGWP